MNKICTKCKIEKDTSEFSYDNSKKDKFNSWCKECIKLRKNSRTTPLNGEKECCGCKIVKNFIEFGKGSDKYRLHARCKECDREYGKSQKRKDQKKSTRSTENYKIKANIRATRFREINRIRFAISQGMRRSLKNGRSKNGNHWENLVGYTIQELIDHLTKLFKPGMNIENFGEWHIDHIIPVSSFEIESIECDNFKKCWELSNLQPLWAVENMSKGDKII